MRLRTTIFLHLGPLAALTAAALLLALPLTTALEVELAAPSFAPEVTREDRRAPAPALEEPRLRALLGLTHLPVPAPPAQSHAPFAGRLLGTLCAAEPSRSLASVALPSGRVQTVREGELVLDAEVVAIERLALVLSRHGALERVGLGSGSIPAMSTIAPGAPPAITQLSAIDYRVSRTEVLARMSDLYSLSRGVRVVPAFRDGLPVGFRFATIAGDSPAARLGLESGDLIRAVNGKPLDSVQQVLALAASLERVPEVEIELERAGRVLTHRYRLD
jgi:general secretion pathway protein C